MKKLIPYVLLLAITFIASCKKEDFDEPSPDGADPALVANTTIAQLKDGYVGGEFDSIGTDIIISGIVTADDKSGNFYKTLVIQDETAAIAIRVDVSDYYTKYPIGRRIFVKCKGLWLGDYNELIQLGGFVDYSDPQEPSVEPIPYALVNKYIVPGKYNLSVTPTVVTIDQLKANTFDYQNMLIQLNDVQFSPTDTLKNFAELLVSANRALENCDGDQITVRTSNYATFADVNIPNGKGTLVAIFSVFGTSATAAQLLLRDTYDVNLAGARCGQGGGTVQLVSIQTARGYFTGSTTSAPSDKKIEGIVISDKANVNTDPRNMVIQDATAGIVVRFAANHTFNVGDKVEVVISGQELSEFNGLLEVNDVPNANATVTGTGTVTPAVITIADVIANFESIESTLVKINNATISGTGTTYSGSKTLTDATGSMTLYTRSQATFSGTTFPTGTVSVTGILVPFNSTKQISIRNTTDVQ